MRVVLLPGADKQAASSMIRPAKLTHRLKAVSWLGQSEAHALVGKASAIAQGTTDNLAKSTKMDHRYSTSKESVLDPYGEKSVTLFCPL